MDFQQAIKSCLQKYVTFDGRAGRAEFWWFALFQLVVLAAAAIVSDLLYSLAGLALLLPGMAVNARRLHDVGKSGWFLLLWLVPFIGWGILIYWCAQPSTAANEHGAPAEAPVPAAELPPPGAV